MLNNFGNTFPPSRYYWNTALKRFNNDAGIPFTCQVARQDQQIMLSQNSRNFSRFYNTFVSCSRVAFEPGKVSTVVLRAEHVKMAFFGKRTAGS